METITLDRAVAAAKGTVQEAAEAASEQAAAVAAQAREIKACATEAADQYRRSIQREVGRAMRRVDYARRESAYRIQQAPFSAVALACLAGVAAGAVATWAISRSKGRGDR
jgi:ElaB/YqjD/DUF883 family membrane-anchored ribosome-binding protein